MIELDRHIEILLLSSDCVIIPNFGGFMAHYVEARKDESDSAFLPPMRTIGFNPKLTLNDSLLAQSYVEVYDISYPDAIARIEDEVRELRQRLSHEGQYEMNSIGTLKYQGNGNYEFEPCKAGLLTPSLYGLSYYEFKTLAQIAREQASAEPEHPGVETRLVPHPATQAAVEPDAKADDKFSKAHSSLATLWRNIAVACIAFIIFLLIPTPLANDRSNIYQSKINTGLLEYVMPKESVVGSEHIEHIVKTAKRAHEATPSPKQEQTEQSPEKSGYTIVLASRITRKNATAYVASLRKKGIELAEVYVNNNHAKVVYGHYATRGEAYTMLNKLHETNEFADAWVMKY